MSASTNDLPRDFAHRFRVEGRLGRGGMGDVYKAYDTVLERTVAVKTLTPGNADAQAVERLLREARACARLTHPGIVTIHDVLRAEGSVHIVMEHLEGTSLESLHRLPRFAAPAAKIDVIVRVLDALHYAHGRGVVHRDIKPTNVQLLPDGSVKLLDFGIAHVAGAAALTVTGTMTGTVHYASPEQLRGEESDASTDVYSTGILAYEVLTGRRPFDGDSIGAVVTKALNDALPPMGTELSEESPEIERIVRRATAKRSRDRYAGAADMRDALTAFMASRAVTAPPAAAATEALTAAAAPAAGTAPAPAASIAAAGTASPPAASIAVAGTAPPPAAYIAATGTASPPAARAVPKPPWPRARRRLLAGAAVLVLLAAGAALLDPVRQLGSSDDALPSADGPSALEPEPRSVAAGMEAGEAALPAPAASAPAAAPASAPAALAAGSGRESARVGSAVPGSPPPPGPPPPPPGRPPAPAPSAPPAPVTPPASRPASSTPTPPVPDRGAKDLYYAATSPGLLPAAGAGAPGSAGTAAAGAAGLRYRILREAADGAAVEVDPDTVFRSGDRIRFAFEPNVDGFLYVIQRGSTGRWSVLLPHPEVDGGRNAVSRFAEVMVPSEGWFRFDENPGSEEVFVYLSRERIRTLPWGGGHVVSAQTVEQPTVIELANSVRTRDLVFEKEVAPDGPERAAYVVNQDAVGPAVAWTVELHHR